jgi:hypothetical protein
MRHAAVARENLSMDVRCNRTHTHLAARWKVGHMGCIYTRSVARQCPPDVQLAPRSEMASRTMSPLSSGGEEKRGKTQCVRAVAHVRPLLPRELQEGCQVALDVRDASISVPGLQHANTFQLDAVVESKSRAMSRENSTQLYSRDVSPLVDGLFAGINATVFAYGQTGAGKSFTMGMQHEPAHACEQVQEEGGWVPITHAVFEDVAARVERLKQAGTRTTLSCSVFEVHNVGVCWWFLTTLHINNPQHAPPRHRSTSATCWQARRRRASRPPAQRGAGET